MGFNPYSKYLDLIIINYLLSNIDLLITSELMTINNLMLINKYKSSNIDFLYSPTCQCSFIKVTSWQKCETDNYFL